VRFRCALHQDDLAVLQGQVGVLRHKFFWQGTATVLPSR
jgi:hypothetical protein